MIDDTTLSFTEGCISWLQAVFRERYGVDFVIDFDNGLILSLPGSDRQIDFDNGLVAFSQPGSAIPCASWSPQSEGYAGVLEEPLPLPGLGSAPEALVQSTDRGHHIRFDIPGFAMWMMSRHEEAVNPARDEHDRFPAMASHAYMHNYLERPVVDEWLHILGQVIERTWPSLSLRTHEASQLVSHDVDLPSVYMFKEWRSLLRISASLLLRHGRIGESMNAVRIRGAHKQQLHAQDPANTFDWIFRHCAKHGMQNAFYFICGNTNQRFDADYRIEHPAMRQLLNDVHRHGHEIGLHPSYDTFRNRDAFFAEANRLRRVCGQEGIEQSQWGGRMHYLRWAHPETAYLWEGAGMSYDSTAGYAARPGFRCGTCFEFPALDPLTGKRLNLTIRPLIAMEVSVMSAEYLGLRNPEAAFQKFAQLKDRCRKVGGNFTLLWHNSELITDQNKALYEQVVAH